MNSNDPHNAYDSPSQILSGKLFVEEGRLGSIARVSWREEMIYTYADGYRLAAEQLVNEIKDTGYQINFLIYPVVYLYRQYVELTLKIATSQARVLAGEGSEFPTNHKISEIWIELKGRIKQCDYGIESKQLNEVDEIIVEFAKFDPESFAFRFPRSKKNAPSVGAPLERINIQHFEGKIAVFSDFFDGLIGMQSDYLSSSV